ncbi:MAG: hypothetical protein IPK00_16290 [Deltaproteobacteria bacterium]|nr:hypothetical protein [Deltaproteobacteria bacterium]
MSAAAIEALPGTIDAADWPELSYRLGLTDGLPTFPPDRARVDRLVAASGLAADHRIGTIPPAGRVATVEAVAANAVMAGCLPEHFPIVLVALRSMLEPRFNFGGVVTTTHPCWPLVIVSGRAVTDLGMATRESVFNGGGARANLAIGRAIRLVTWNLGGAHPRQPVQEIMGHPGRMAYCIAEEPERTPWESLGRFRGADDGAGSVTVFACEGPQICNPWGIATRDGEKVGLRWLELVADQMSGRGNSNTHTMGEILVVFNPAMARTLSREGFDRARIQQFLFETARRRLGDIRVEPDGRPSVTQDAYYEWWPESVDQSDPEAMVPVVWSPESIHIVVAGGDSIPCAAICPSWGHLGGFAITKAL